jgi:hypothetical protein
MSNSNPPAPAPRWLVCFGLLALAAYAVMIGFYFTTAAGGSDSSGYFNSARLFTEGKFDTELRIPAEFTGPLIEDRLQFLPLGFWPFPGNPHITPTYPTGLPLHFALAAKLLGWLPGSIAVGLFAAIGAVWLCYATARELGLEARLAAAGAAVLGLSPMFLFTAVQPLSDTLATTWALAAMWTALRAHRSTGWAIACGAAYAMAVLVRPTNLLLAPAVVIFLGLDWKNWKKFLCFGLGGVPGAIWQGVYNHALYGGALKSGYGSIFETFHWDLGPPTALHILKWLALLLPTVLLALPFVAVTHAELRTRNLLGLAVWFGVITGLYTFYEVTHEVWWCLRFILPAFPALIIGGLFGVEAIARRFDAASLSRFYNITALGFAVWAAVLARYWTREFYIMNTKSGEQTYVEGCDELKKRFPPGTLVVTMTFSGALYFYTDFPVLRWDQVKPERFAEFVAAATTAGRQICAVDFKWEEEKALRQHCPGNWEHLATLHNASIWRLVPPTPAAATK